MEKYLTGGDEDNTIAKQASISYLRILATICVIWAHTCSTLCDNPDLFDLNRAQGDFFNSSYQMMYWAVPVFFMITGALLLDPNKEISAKDCVCVYAKRIFLALLIFGIPYAALKIFTQTGISMKLLVDCIKAFWEDSGFGHLWYLYILIGIYLILPLLRCFVKYATKDEVRLLMIVLAIFDFAVQLITDLTGIKIGFTIPLSYPIFYNFLGYLINKHKDYLKKKRKFLYMVLLIAILIVWIVNILQLVPKSWTTYTSPLMAMMAFAVFGLFVTHEFEYKEYVWKIDRLCFGAYLMHPLFIQFAYRFLKITPLSIEVYPIGTLGLFTIFVIFAFASAWVLRLIPLFRKYIL